MRILQKTDRKINIVGIDDHELTGLGVVTAAALFDTQKGPVIGIFNEYVHHGKGRSIHAAGQMEWLNFKIDERSKVVGGAQRIETCDGYIFPLSIESGLVYMHSIWAPTDDDLQQYPHVFCISPDIWDASVVDHGITAALLEEIIKKLMILYSRTPFLMNLEIVTNEWHITWMFSGTQAPQRLGSIPFMLIFMKAILLSKTGNHFGFTLVGNLNKSSKIHTK